MCAIGSAALTLSTPPLPARAASVCPPSPGKDGTANFGTNNGIENAYFIPATGTVAAGSTTLTLSSATADTSAGGANIAIAVNDELVVMQMQSGKSVTVQTTNCSGTPPAGTVCPGGILLYAIDYRNIMVGGASEATLTPSPLLATSKTTSPLAINDNGTTTWAANSGGLYDALVASANGTTTYGDSTAGSTFTGGTVGSKNFTCTVGGSGFSLVAPGVTGTSQGTLYYRTKVN